MSGISKFTKQLIPVISLLVLILQFSVLGAAEKSVKVSTTQSSKISAVVENGATLKADRSSKYKDISDPGLMLEKSNKNKVTIKGKNTSQFRDKNLSSTLKSDGFSFASANVYMNIDQDGDGYYSDFSVNFDADTNYNYATVYARLYLSFDGGPWELYYVTDYFDLDGWSAYDDYTVRTQLTSGFPPGSYDILIDLIDAYDDALLATISSWDTYNLAEHYLEDISYESSATTGADYSIFDASITLLEDNDNDGFYQSFSLLFDADVISGEALVYAEIWVRDSSGIWQQDYVTDDFTISGNSTLDTFIIETVWESGYDTGYYDFRIELYDAYSFELLTTSDELSSQLYEVPLEDAAADYQSNNAGGGNNNSPSTNSYGSGGAGSSGILLILMMLGFSIRRLYQ